MRRKQKEFIQTLQTLISVASVAMASLAQQGVASSRYEPLQESLPALPEELRLGSKYVPGTSTKYVRGYANKFDLQEWQEIPPWLGRRLALHWADEIPERK